MTQQGATLQNYNNELVKCAFAYFRIFWRHQTLADRAADTPILLFILFQALRTCARSARRSTGRSRRMRRRRVRAAVLIRGARFLQHAHTRLIQLTRLTLCSPLSLLIVRSQDPERPSDPDRAARAHQRQPRAQDHLAQRVRQNHPGDGGRLLEGACPPLPLPLPLARRWRCHCPPLLARRESVCAHVIACVSRRLWRARKRCCTFSSARASTSRRRSRPRRERRSSEREVERAASARTRMVVWRGRDLGGARVPRSFSFGARVWTVCGAQTLTECVFLNVVCEKKKITYNTGTTSSSAISSATTATKRT